MYLYVQSKDYYTIEKENTIANYMRMAPMLKLYNYNYNELLITKVLTLLLWLPQVCLALILDSHCVQMHICSMHFFHFVQVLLIKNDMNYNHNMNQPGNILMYAESPLNLTILLHKYCGKYRQQI